MYNRKYGPANEYKPGEVAELFGVARSTICYWAQDGKLKFREMPGGARRFTRKSVEAFAKKRGLKLRKPTEDIVSVIMKRAKNMSIRKMPEGKMTHAIYLKDLREILKSQFNVKQ